MHDGLGLGMMDENNAAVGNVHLPPGRSDPVSLSSWILEAGTPSGQVQRAQRALGGISRERDHAVFRYKEVRGVGPEREA